MTRWESVLPQCCLDLPGDLAEIDQVLDDEPFLEPFRPFFDPVIGRRRSERDLPADVFFKYRYRLGYEPLCREVADSIAWRRFCRLRLDQAPPHPTTLMKINLPVWGAGGGRPSTTRCWRRRRRTGHQHRHGAGGHHGGGG